MRAAFALVTFASGAEAAEWSVQKASGQVWVISDRISPAVLDKKTILTSGATLQTGPNGRVLLVRDEETIVVTPNTVISLPGEATESGMTRILQQAGSIVVKAQKRDVEHFQIETPYLAAIVKGTEFVVTLEPGTADVEVITGEVEVADYNSGEVASIKQGQAARSQGDRGLILRGTGIFSLIRKGEPVKAVLELIKVPKNGLRAPPPKSRASRAHCWKPTWSFFKCCDAGRCIGTVDDRRVAESFPPRTSVSLRPFHPLLVNFDF